MKIDNVMSYDEAFDWAQERQALCGAVKTLIVDRLDLVVDPAWITDDQPLFGRGLELDSVDALEVAVGMEHSFDVVVTDDDVGALGSINTVVDYIASHGYADQLLAAGNPT